MGGLWAVEIPLRNGTEEKVGVQEIKVGGWKEDLARMGFEVPIDEMEKGQIVGQKWLIAGGRPGFFGGEGIFSGIRGAGEGRKINFSL